MPTICGQGPECGSPLTNVQSTLPLVGDRQSFKGSLDIRDSQRGDNGSYSFMREKGNELWALDIWEHHGATGQTWDGTPLNLTYSVPWASESRTPPISWMSTAFTSLGPMTPLSLVLSLTHRPQNHGTNLTCQVTFPGAGVTVDRTMQLSVTCE
ncbi:sialic acid-binding Ig-like lectin 6 [Phodopus roborovskii]|uniref:sialic acid-binding Ig-like lectin 6 n=1 Tax=Phodopus roborovskii TaxID=109678 RepID=UPI0021E4B04E|nr:sialic acid-binding Ig-like lectin 6 [Phodopus roborovskii]